MEKLLVVDGNSIINRAFYGVRLLTNEDGVYTNAKHFTEIFVAGRPGLHCGDI